MRKHTNGEASLRAPTATGFAARSGWGLNSVVCDASRKSCRRAIILCACVMFVQHFHGGAAQDSRPDEGNQHGHGGTPQGRLVSVKPLDLSRAPTTEELMAAGQLGGVLFPTHELQDKRREESARLDFGQAIEAWNKHEYPKAIQLFNKHVEKFPDSPWAG